MNIFGAFIGVVVGAYTGNWSLLASQLIGEVAAQDARRQAKRKFNDSQKDRIQTIRSATAPAPIIYGRARVGGVTVYAQSTGAKGEYMHLVVALAAHELDAIETIYFNDVALPAANGTTGLIESGEFCPSRTETRFASQARSAGAAFSITLTVNAGETLESVSVTRTVSYGANSQSLSQTFTQAGNVISGTTGAGNGSYSVTAVVVQYVVRVATPRVRIRQVLGTTTQAAFSELVSESGGKWTAAHQLKGIAALYIRLQFDQDLFAQIGIPNISAVVRGRKVLDTRTGTTAWSRNAALCTADYLRTYMGASAAELPTAEINAEANVCDQAVTLTVGGATEPRYCIDGVLGTEGTPRAHLEALTEAMAGTAYWSQGRWLIRAGAHRTSSLTITEDMLAGSGVQIQAATRRTDQINRVQATYYEPGRAYTKLEAPPVINATYLAADGGIDLPLRLDLDMVISSWQAQRLGKIAMERARAGLTVTLKCNLRAYDLSPGDTVALTLSRYGWSAKLFTVVEWSIDLSERTIGLTLRESASTLWDWAFGEASAVDLTPNTTLPNPLTRPAALTGLAATSGTAYLQAAPDGSLITRALVSWTASTEVFVANGGRIELQWIPAYATDWNSSPSATGDATSALIGPLPNAGVIYVRARAVNSMGRASEWTMISHTVVGKSQAPANVSLLAPRVITGAVVLSWVPSGEIDYAETEIRLGATWATATLLHVGKGSVYAWPWPAVGAYTVLVKHRDTSGNESAAAASMTISVNADGTVGLGYALQWTDGLGNPATWSDGGAGTGAWVSDEAITYLAETQQIAPQAFTGSQSAVAADVVCTQAQHVPDGEGFRDSVVSLTYFAEAQAQVIVSVEGSFDYLPTGDGTASLVGHIMRAGRFLEDVSGAPLSVNFFGGFGYPGMGTRVVIPVSASRRFMVSAREVVTFKLASAMWSPIDTVSFSGRLSIQVLPL